MGSQAINLNHLQAKTAEMAGAITNPGLIPGLINNPNSVFIIEDNEILLTRCRNRQS